MTLFRNIRITDSQSPFNGQNKDILIENHIISKIEPPFSIIPTPEMKIIAHEAACISPGWVDLQTHISDPGYEWKETLEQTAAAAAKGGFTTILGHPETDPCADNASVIRFLYEKSKALPVNFYFAGALTQSQDGKDFSQLYEMHTENAPAFTDGLHYPQSAGLMLRLRQYLSAFDGLMMVYPFDKSIAGDAQINEGNVSLMIGMKGTPEIAESVAVAKEISLHEYTPVRTHFQSVVSEGTLAILSKKKKQDPLISCGLPAFYLSLSEDCLLDFDTHYKVFPPLKSKRQIECLIKAITDNTIEVITSGHYPQGLEEKNCEFEIAEYGMLNLQTAFASAYAALVEANHLSIDALIDKFTYSPRKVLRVPSVSVNIGQIADLTVFSVNSPWTLNKENIPSTAKNSPFLGRTFNLDVIGVFPAHKSWVGK